MRATLLALASGLLLCASGAALAADGDASAAPPSVPEPVAYSANDGNVTCHHMVHEGMVTSVVQCHTQAGWDRLRLQTQEAVSDFQLRGHLESPYH